MRTIYVVNEKLAEYNDEIYVFPEGSQGKPVNAYTDALVAENICFLHNWRWLLDNADPEKNEYPHYEYRFHDMFWGSSWERLQEYGLATDELLFFSEETTEKLPIEVKKYLVEHSIAPFHVVECTLYE
jgi:hypothetical protein